MHTVAPFWRALALVLPLVAIAGCDWIPARRRISPSLYPVPVRPDGGYIRTDRVAGRPPDVPDLRIATEDARPTEVAVAPAAKPTALPALFPITSEEALTAAPPTPILDAALARAKEVRAAVLGPDLDLDATSTGDVGIEPTVGPIDFDPVPATEAIAEDATPIEVPSPPEEAEASTATITPSPEDVEEAADAPEGGNTGPDPATPEAVDPPEVAFKDDATEQGGGLRDELERIFGEAEARAGLGGDATAIDDARSRALDWLDRAEASGAVDEATLWETVMAMLAEPATVDLQAPPEPSGVGTVGMAPAAVLRIADARFCREIQGYGRVVELDAEHCRAGGDVILYCELEGVRYLASGDGYASRVATTLEIVPEAGGAAAWRELRLADDHCPRPRRDYFVSYWITIPETLPPGRYRLAILQRDEHSGAEANAAIPFAIVK